MLLTLGTKSVLYFGVLNVYPLSYIELSISFIKIHKLLLNTNIYINEKITEFM